MRILAIEDEPSMAELLRSALTEEGHQVAVAVRGDEGLRMAQADEWDLIVLDLMLPGMNGFELSRRLRREKIQVPILVLTARDTNSDVVAALDEGADDYLTKPFALEIFLARVRAVGRRGRIPQPVYFSAGALTLCTSSREVKRDGKQIALTPREYKLLELLIRNSQRVVPRSRIVEAVWGWDANVEDNTLDVFIRSLRQKVERPDAEKLIWTVRGVGYCLRFERD